MAINREVEGGGSLLRGSVYLLNLLLAWRAVFEYNVHTKHYTAVPVDKVRECY